MGVRSEGGQSREVTYDIGPSTTGHHLLETEWQEPVGAFPVGKPHLVQVSMEGPLPIKSAQTSHRVPFPTAFFLLEQSPLP